MRYRENWSIGAEKWRNPDDDLPSDFEANRVENHPDLRKPIDPRRFTAELAAEMDAELSALNDAVGGKGLAWLKISESVSGTIQPTPSEASPELRNLLRLKTAIRSRWGVVPLMDISDRPVLSSGRRHWAGRTGHWQEARRAELTAGPTFFGGCGGRSSPPRVIESMP
ncbi:hypothetical protein AB0E01_44320 [Nocardia vinacea]|uniref:hypothetical protein n=1 Tax=Nocardia vinacea TaxID=96468 RepID=UPI0033F3F39D